MGRDMPSLKEAVRQAAEGQLSTAAGDSLNEGLLYRRWNPSQSMGSGSEIEQLVLPRKAVLHLAHEIPLAGHLGRKKTCQQITERFYWPSFFKDVGSFCKSCEKCQKMGHQRRVPVPLVPLPVIDEPFQWVAMEE